MGTAAVPTAPVVALAHDAVCYASQAVAAHAARTSQSAVRSDDVIVDLVTDLLHLAAAVGLDPAEVTAEAHNYFAVETAA